MSTARPSERRCMSISPRACPWRALGRPEPPKYVGWWTHVVSASMQHRLNDSHSSQPRFSPNQKNSKGSERDVWMSRNASIGEKSASKPCKISLSHISNGGLEHESYRDQTCSANLFQPRVSWHCYPKYRLQVRLALHMTQQTRFSDPDAVRAL